MKSMKFVSRRKELKYHFLHHNKSWPERKKIWNIRKRPVFLPPMKNVLHYFFALCSFLTNFLYCMARVGKNIETWGKNIMFFLKLNFSTLVSNHE